MPSKSIDSKYLNNSVLSPEARVFYAILLIVVAVLGRTLFHIGDNVEFVTAATLLSSAYLGLSYGLIVPLSIMVISDLIIGNTNIFLFTWSAYLITGVIGFIFLKTPQKHKSVISKSLFTAMLSSVFFYIWTNYGVWALDGFGMYSKNLNGLIDSYIMGIPFFKSNLLSNIIIVPVAFIIFPWILNFSGSFTRKNIFSFKK